MVIPLFYKQNNPESIQGKRIKDGLESRGYKIEILDELTVQEFIPKSIYLLLHLMHLTLTTLSRIIPRPFKDLFLLNEPYAVFNKSYLKMLELKIISNPDSLVLTSSTPFCIHEIGVKIKEIHGNKWIMRMSDPYVDNPYSKATLRWTRLRQLNKESKYFHLADGISVTSDNYLKILNNRYPNLKNKLYLIYHSISSNTSAIEAHSPDGKNYSIKGAFLGNIYGRRKPTSLLFSLKKYNKRLESLGVEVHFHGKVMFRYKVLVKLLFLSEIVYFHGQFKQSESDGIMNGYDFFVNIESNDKPNPFFPSKLTDYFRFQKPILNLAPVGSLSRRLLNNINYSANPNNIEEIGHALDYIMGSINKEIIYNTVDMTLENVIDKYCKLIEGV